MSKRIALLVGLLTWFVAGIAYALPVTVNPGSYTGYWSYGSQSHQGSATIDLPVGVSVIGVAFTSSFYVSTSSSGVVTVQNGISAVGGQNQLTFANSSVGLTRNGYTGYVNYPYAATIPSGPTGNVTLVPGLDYRLCMTAGPEACVYVHVNADGTTTSTRPTTARAIGSGFELVTVPLSLVRNGYTGYTNIWYGPAFPAGDSTVTMVADADYRLCATVYAGTCFDISLDADGNVTSAADAAVTSGHTLGFATVPVAIDRAGYAGYVNIYYGPALDAAGMFTLPRGLTYMLCAAANFESCFPLAVGAAGSVTTTGPAVASGNLVTLATIQLDVSTSPSSFWAVWYGPPGKSGAGSVLVVPDLGYQMNAGGILKPFTITSSCVVTPSSYVAGSVSVTLGCTPPVTDADDDGVDDDLDNCLTDANPDQANLDGDALGDACDLDSDGDLVLDEADNCLGLANSDQADLDSDTVGDACDADVDGDTVANDVDNCPEANNSDQLDSDGDATGDACDGDDDDDGVDDGSDVCPFVFDPEQVDSDEDALGDACDSDLDGDGIENADDNCFDAPNPNQADSDGDALGDVCDDDDDEDAVPDAEDNCLFVVNTDQANSDLDDAGDACDTDDDDDGVADLSDICPLIFDPEQGDLDGDGVGDACDGDDDADGVADGVDDCPGSAMNQSVNALGCTGAQLVAAKCVAGDFSNHGKYVKCVQNAAQDAYSQGLITLSERQRLITTAARGN